ncbi:hypothetical protein LINPERPRIM_LOCUS7410 [Linum perenne]
MATFPKHVVLYSEGVGKYANFSAGDPIQVNGKQAWNPHSRFEIEQSMIHPAMIHIRCSYNNKYLQPHNRDYNLNYMEVVTDEPEDDQTKLTSTCSY